MKNENKVIISFSEYEELKKLKTENENLKVELYREKLKKCFYILSIHYSAFSVGGVDKFVEYDSENEAGKKLIDKIKKDENTIKNLKEIVSTLENRTLFQRIKNEKLLLPGMPNE